MKLEGGNPWQRIYELERALREIRLEAAPMGYDRGNSTIDRICREALGIDDSAARRVAAGIQPDKENQNGTHTERCTEDESRGGRGDRDKG